MACHFVGTRFIAPDFYTRCGAQYLLCTPLGVSRASLIAHGERGLTAQQAAQFASHVAARATGVPVAQIPGRREFYGRDFAVNEHVLIPRPETEILAEQTLARFSGNKWLKTAVPPCVLDLGTGSGAIAVTLALEWPCAVMRRARKPGPIPAPPSRRNHAPPRGASTPRHVSRLR